MITELMFDTDKLPPAKINRFMTEQDKFRTSLLINSEHVKRCNTIIDKFPMINSIQYCDKDAKYKSKTIIFMNMS